MNTGSLLKNSHRLMQGIIMAPHVINRKTLGLDGFRSPVNEPRRTLGIIIRTKAMANVRFLSLSEKNIDQFAEDGCERRNRNVPDVLLPDFERMKQMNMLEQHLLKLPARMKELQNLE